MREAIRSGNRQLLTGLNGEPALAALRRIMPADTACLLALPLYAGAGRSFGALAIGTAAPEGFDAEEQRLLEELAEDLAFAIVALRTRAGRDAHAFTGAQADALPAGRVDPQEELKLLRLLGSG